MFDAADRIPNLPADGVLSSSPAPRVLNLVAPAAEGGLETVVRLLSRESRKRALDVGVLVLNQLGGAHPFSLAALADGAELAEVPSGRRRYLSEARSVAMYLREGGWSVLHTHGYHADIVGRIASRRAGFPIVTTAHGTTGGDWKNRLYERLQWWTWRSFDRVIAVSAPLASRIVASGVPSDRVRTIRNAWEPGSVMTRAAARLDLGLPVEGQRIGWIGRLGAEKGPDVMLDAMAELGRPDVQLSMIGRGPMEEGLRHQASARGIARVTWHGAVPNAGARLAAFDVVVLSSRTEGTPMVLFEAMSAQVPVVTTAVGGIPDVVRASEAMLVPPERPAELAAAILATLDDPEAARRRAGAARARLAAEFGAASWIARHRELYEEVVQTHAGRSR